MTSHLAPRLDADLLVPGLLHELRQPLAGAEAMAALLERDRVGLAGLPDWRILRGQLARLSELVDGYAAMFGAAATGLEEYEVGPVVRRAVNLLAHRVRPLEDRFLLAGDGSPLRAHGTPSALVHAVTNLLSNALDAVEDGAPGGGRRRVAVRVEGGTRGRRVEVRVSDQGGGVPAAIRHRLFQPRVTTKAPGRGSGIGLHLSRLLVARDGGEVYLVDDDDPGRLPWAVTEFCIALPPCEEGRP